MTQQGAALQNYNNELVKCIEELCQKREELCRQIQQEEDEKQRLQSEVRQLTEKLARVNENLARKIASRNEFDRTIAETEAAYLKAWHRLGRSRAGLCEPSDERDSDSRLVSPFPDPGKLTDSA
ncbi:Sjoegren syndrome nuclear autoantigen 1 isoform X1 [Felis catus]|uniref:Sjoegren syndrome nuclear autoantigen 1 isoform X1 n=1 Tax=Felis catus TaxID=9685 RepID=UPI001D19EE2E|nr:Sjoegren syndrome nuclear autoantigen 1 isoform X1 [Felis catus]